MLKCCMHLRKICRRDKQIGGTKDEQGAFAGHEIHLMAPAHLHIPQPNLRGGGGDIYEGAGGAESGEPQPARRGHSWGQRQYGWPILQLPRIHTHLRESARCDDAVSKVTSSMTPPSPSQTLEGRQVDKDLMTIRWTGSSRHNLLL